MIRQIGSASLMLALACTPVQGATNTAVAPKIRAEVAEIIHGINSKNIDEATKYDAPDLVSMESGREPSTGAKSDREGLSMAFKYAPNWHLTMVDETVDASPGSDLAVYRGTYAEDSMRDGVPFTHTGNYIAGFRHDPDGIWRVHWSVIAWQSPSHKK